MDTNMKGRVALVTGGATGIGKACALALAQEGARVVITGRRENLGAEAVAEIRGQGGEARFVRTDPAMSEIIITDGQGHRRTIRL